MHVNKDLTSYEVRVSLGLNTISDNFCVKSALFCINDSIVPVRFFIIWMRYFASLWVTIGLRSAPSLYIFGRP